MNKIKFKAEVVVSSVKCARVRAAIFLIRCALTLLGGHMEISEAALKKPRKAKAIKSLDSKSGADSSPCKV